MCLAKVICDLCSQCNFKAFVWCFYYIAGASFDRKVGFLTPPVFCSPFGLIKDSACLPFRYVQLNRSAICSIRWPIQNLSQESQYCLKWKLKTVFTMVGYTRSALTNWIFTRLYITDRCLVCTTQSVFGCNIIFHTFQEIWIVACFEHRPIYYIQYMFHTTRCRNKCSGGILRNMFCLWSLNI